MGKTQNRVVKCLSMILIAFILISSLPLPVFATGQKPTKPVVEKLAFAEYEAALAQLKARYDLQDASLAENKTPESSVSAATLPTRTEVFWETEPNSNSDTASKLPVPGYYLGDPEFILAGHINGSQDVDIYKISTYRGTITLFGQWVSDELYAKGHESNLLISLYDLWMNPICDADLVYNTENPTEHARYLEELLTFIPTCYVVVRANPERALDYVGEPYGIVLNFVPRFTVTFSNQYGEIYPSLKVDEGMTIPEPARPTREGYTFTGWYLNDNEMQQWNFATNVVTDDMVLYAKWKLNQYTVTFKDWDGTVLKTETVAHGSAATAPAPKGRPNYTFAGWDTDFSIVKSNLTITAKYELNKYTVKFRNWDGTILKTETVTHGQAATAPVPPAREFYTFTGWDKPFNAITGPLTVTTQYAPVTYAVTFKDWDGSTLATQSVGYGESAMAPATPNRPGFLLSGWDKPFDRITGPLTVTAQYMAVPANGHIVRFVDWNGYILKTETVVDGTAATAPAAPARIGFTFTGWDRSFAPVATDLTVTAVYAANQYTITFNTSGGSAILPVKANHGAAIAEPAPPIRSGYWFNGWFKDAACTDDWLFDLDVVTVDLTIHAKWTQKTAQEQVSAFVTRFYILCLGREPDPAGLKSWEESLLTKRNTGADVGYGFVNSPEFKAKNVSDQEYVTILYRAFFDRNPDQGGFDSWVNVLSNGMSRYSVLAGFTNSDEFSKLVQTFGIERGTLEIFSLPDKNPEITAFVTRFYKLCLGRMPDEHGLGNWVYNLKNHLSTGADVGYGFVFSPEFQQRNVTNEEYVTILYRAFFDRAPDAGGYSGWLGVLSKGGTRYSVLRGFTNSIEFDKLCIGFGITRGTLK